MLRCATVLRCAFNYNEVFSIMLIFNLNLFFSAQDVANFLLKSSLKEVEGTVIFEECTTIISEKIALPI